MEKNQEGELGGTELSGERSEVPAAEAAESGLTETQDYAEQIVSEIEPGNELDRPLRLVGCRKGVAVRRMVKKGQRKVSKFTPEQRLLILDTWRRSGLPATEFAPLVGMTNHTLYCWKKKFDEFGPAGLMDQPRGGPKGSRLPELTKRTIVMLKEANPDYGCQRISDMLARGPALPASPGAVAKVLREAGYEMQEVKTRPHKDKVRRFERATANQMWQTDLFTFILKRQNRRVYLVAFLDDHSRFIVGFGLYASQAAVLVMETLRAAISSYGAPQEILSDNGTQYVTWRGKSAFSKELEKRGIKHLVAKPKRPQTLGKTERFWGTLWRECVETSVFLDMEDARKRIGLFIDHYNFRRTHQGIDGLAPADRFFGVASEVLKNMKERVATNALELARNGLPKKPFYLTGQVGGKTFSVHAAGERVFMSDKEGKEEIDLVGSDKPQEIAEELPDVVTPTAVLKKEEEIAEPAPGASNLDEGLAKIAKAFSDGSEDQSGAS